MNTPSWAPRAILFDLDGTLIDSAADLALAVNRMREARGLPPLPTARYRPFVGSGARGLLPIGLDVQPEDDRFAQLREEFFDTYEACLGQATQPFEGVAALVERLRQQQLPWGIVTNKIERFATPIAQRTAALQGCGALVGGDTTAHSKPHPEPLLEAARRLKIAPQDCIYVGDDRRDMQAGKAAGMHTVAALYGYIAPTENTNEWLADWRIQSPTELLGLLRI